MPCCAFAACIVAQFLLGARAIKRAIFRQSGDEFPARNLAVEWRLDPAAVSIDLGPVSARRFLGRGRSLRGFAVAAALEILIAGGAIYGIIGHFGHGAGHAAHAHRVEGSGREPATERGALDADVAALPGAFKR